MDADAKPDAPLVRHPRLAVDHPALDLGGTAHRIDDAGKFRQNTVAGFLYRVAPVLPDLWLDQLRKMRPEALVRALLVRPHQARISRHIGDEDRSKMAARGHRVRHPTLVEQIG